MHASSPHEVTTQNHNQPCRPYTSACAFAWRFHTSGSMSFAVVRLSPYAQRPSLRNTRPSRADAASQTSEAAETRGVGLKECERHPIDGVARRTRSPGGRRGRERLRSATDSTACNPWHNCALAMVHNTGQASSSMNIPMQPNRIEPPKRLSAIAATLALATVALAVAIPAHAQSYLKPTPPPHSYEERFRLEVDVLYGSYDTQLRIDQQPGAGGTTPTPGTVLSGEDDLGLASSQFLGQVELTLLPGKHHMVRLNGLSMRRDGHKVLTRSVSFEDEDYVVGERVDSFLNLSFVGLTYGYLPFRTDRYELGVTFGIQIASVSANAEVRSRVIREADSAAGPLPLFGIEGRFDFTRRLSVDMRYQYFGLNTIELQASIGDAVGVDVQELREAINDKTATVQDGRLALRWRQNQHFVYGLGYRYFNINVESPLTDPAGAVTIGLTGPVLFVQASL